MAKGAIIGKAMDPSGKRIKGAKGVSEIKIHYGPGYRIFYSLIKGQIILLLAASKKKDQVKTIRQVRGYLADYKERMK